MLLLVTGHQLNSLSLWPLSHLERQLEQIWGRGTVELSQCPGLLVTFQERGLCTRGHTHSQGRIWPWRRTDLLVSFKLVTCWTNYRRGSQQQEFSMYRSSLKLWRLVWLSKKHAVNGIIPCHYTEHGSVPSPFYSLLPSVSMQRMKPGSIRNWGD